MNTPQQQHLVDWAHWFQKNSKSTKEIYTEGAKRMDEIGRWPLVLPINSDCSGFVTLLYWLAGLPDPNNCHYNHTGYTGTLLAHGTKIPLNQVQPGDVIVYGPGTGWHTALIVDVTGANAKNPLTISHGQQGDPSYVHVNQDGRLPQTYLRFNTSAINAQGIHTPPSA